MRSILWMITKWWCIMFDIVMKDGHCWSDLMILLSWSHFTSGDRVYVCVETCKTLGSGCVLLPGRLNTITRWLDSKQCLGCTGLQCWQPSLKRDLYCLSLLAPPPTPPHPLPEGFWHSRKCLSAFQSWGLSLLLSVNLLRRVLGEKGSVQACGLGWP